MSSLLWSQGFPRIPTMFESHAGQTAYSEGPKFEYQDLPPSTFVDLFLARVENLFSQSRTENTSSDESLHTAADALVRQVLGTRASERFAELKMVQEGWNLGKGLAMGPAAESNLAAFLSRIQSPPENARLFLLEDGAIEVQWKNLDKKRVSVVATSGGFEVLRQDSVKEQKFSDSEFERLFETVGLVDVVAA